MLRAHDLSFGITQKEQAMWMDKCTAGRNTEGPSELHSMPACFLACKNPIQKAEDKKHAACILPVLSKVRLDDTTQIPHCRRTHFSSLGLELSLETQTSPPKRKSRHDSDCCFHVRGLILDLWGRSRVVGAVVSLWGESTAEARFTL